MPFDPDAYLASKSSTGGFDPDAYLTSKASATPQPKAPEAPKDTRSDTRKLWDRGNMATDMFDSTVRGTVAAPIANMAGLARTAWEGIVHGSKGDGDAPTQTKTGVKRAIEQDPQNPEVGKLMAPVGAVVDPVRKILHSGAEWLRGDGPADSARGMAANAVVEGVKQAPNMLGVKAAPMVPGAVRTVTGATARGAREEALTATRRALSDVDATHATTQAGHEAERAGALSEAKAYEDEAVRTQRHLDALRTRAGVPGSEAIGKTIRDTYQQTIDTAKQARSQAVDPLYAKAREQAKLREATGARANVQPALADLDAMIEQSQHIPDLNAKLLKLRQSIAPVPQRAGPPAPLGKGKVSSTIKPSATVVDPQALTYEQLETASRYVKDIAFSGEAEGYGALIRNTAKKLSMDLDRQISAFVPEHAEAAAMYRKMSEPMETVSTKFGRALRDTEGGLKEDAYHSIAAQDLPKRLFAKREGIEQLVDALAGGKDVQGPARAAAQAKVDTWVENWILDASKGATPGEVMTPDRRAALSAAPGARESLERKLSSEHAATRQIPELQQGAKQARASADDAASKAQAVAKKRQDIQHAIERADLDLAHGSREDAYKGYKDILRKHFYAADPARYKAAIALLERAATEEKRLVLAKRLAAGVAASAGLGVAYKAGVAAPGLMQ